MNKKTEDIEKQYKPKMKSRDEYFYSIIQIIVLMKKEKFGTGEMEQRGCEQNL